MFRELNQFERINKQKIKSRNYIPHQDLKRVGFVKILKYFGVLKELVSKNIRSSRVRSDHVNWFHVYLRQKVSVLE